jgi:steroid delta-isomerase-like uncharacterized protein
MTREEIVALLERRTQAVNRHDVAALAALHAMGGAIESVMAPRVLGRAAIEEFYRRLFEAFPDFHYEPQDAIIDGDRVAELATFEATHTGLFMGVPGSGRRVRVPGVFIFTLRNHEIERLRSVYDFTGLLVQASVMKIKPS